MRANDIKSVLVAKLESFFSVAHSDHNLSHQNQDHSAILHQFIQFGVRFPVCVIIKDNYKSNIDFANPPRIGGLRQ
jgi:hypothetical protein